MPEIDSPLGRRRLAMPTPRVLNVSDESETIPTRSQQTVAPNLSQKTQEELEVARKDAMLARKRISPSAKERIEFLINLGRAKTEVTFENVTFTLQSLKAGEMKDVLYASSKCETDGDSMFTLRTYTLAYSLDKIDGQPIGTILGSDELIARLELIEEMDEELIEFLHRSYNAMIQENKKKFMIKNEMEAKEVAEDLKKS